MHGIFTKDESASLKKIYSRQIRENMKSLILKEFSYYDNLIETEYLFLNSLLICDAELT